MHVYRADGFTVMYSPIPPGNMFHNAQSLMSSGGQNKTPFSNNVRIWLAFFLKSFWNLTVLQLFINSVMSAILHKARQLFFHTLLTVLLLFINQDHYFYIFCLLLPQKYKEADMPGLHGPTVMVLKQSIFKMQTGTELVSKSKSHILS